jgi:phage-related protein
VQSRQSPGPLTSYAFQKKSEKGVKTPADELNLIRQRLKAAEEHHAERRAAEERRRSREQ